MTAAVLLEPPTLRRPPSWMTAAACAGMAAPDLDPWQAPTDEGLSPDVRARLVGIAVDVCARCPVARECLEDALATGEAYSVRGGTTPAERRRIAADRGLRRPSPSGASQHGTNGGYQTCTAGPGGSRCDRCKAGHAAAVARWRAQRRWSATPRLTLVVHELHVPTGRGRVRAFPGQLFLDLEVAA